MFAKPAHVRESQRESWRRQQCRTWKLEAPNMEVGFNTSSPALNDQFTAPGSLPAACKRVRHLHLLDGKSTE